ncbi:MAG: uracil phosphoribosyltransferase [Myxococcales bacterium]|nr:uracil phosphoribosyltransferase [Myxococcales bacterium]
MHDTIYREVRYRASELEHKYGPNVHIVSDVLCLSLLADLCSPETKQPGVNYLVTTLYHKLLHTVINAEFPTRVADRITRMSAYTPEGVWRGRIIDRTTYAVTVDIARAGILPSMVCYDVLNRALEPERVRQDHFVMARTTDAKDAVTGAEISGQKIGGGVDGRILLFPDPMGATGSSLSTAMQWYKDHVNGTPLKVITLNLIITPEFIKRITTDHPNTVIYAYRLDRGLSDPDVFATIPGTHWERERGLDDRQYIVPGGGGFGEIMNNSFV